MTQAWRRVFKSARCMGWTALALVSGLTTAEVPVQADFGAVHASESARELANWVVREDDHHRLPFVLVDKLHAQVYVFNSAGDLQGSSPALMGLAKGDDGMADLGNKPLSLIRPSERTTPAGRFVAALGQNVSGQTILWVDYEQSISLHPVRNLQPQEKRLDRLASPSAEDNRISYGCINVPGVFWRDVVLPAFKNTMGVVYVLPETRSLRSVFAM